MFGFTIVWLGQIVSVLATNMSAFALTIWVFEKTGSATALGLMQVFFITPLLIITPFAGVLVDRHNRKLMMMVSDLMAGLATISILLLQAFGALEVWHLYAAAIFQGLGNAFQWPAYSAAIICSGSGLFTSASPCRWMCARCSLFAEAACVRIISSSSMASRSSTTGVSAASMY